MKFFPSAALFLLVSGAVAQGPTTGEEELAARGERLIARGEYLIARGEKLMARGPKTTKPKEPPTGGRGKKRGPSSRTNYDNPNHPGNAPKGGCIQTPPYGECLLHDGGKLKPIPCGSDSPCRVPNHKCTWTGGNAVCDK
ncbi:unnamed protein product [Clonostachys byssicola]|uniref:Uncharacterized protein n=1 Tax=Clonostachys byssicola TaxID=160290 RepID=A0A9N9UMW8_9HYPO|nr:unnamed protein product [Clonostachys byssicola]